MSWGHKLISRIPAQVIHRVHGELFFGFQVVEQKKHPLVEAHVRCYAVRDETDAWGRHVEFQPCAMRLEKPDDEMGAMLFLSLPSLVVHRCVEINQ